MDSTSFKPSDSPTEIPTKPTLKFKNFQEPINDALKLPPITKTQEKPAEESQKSNSSASDTQSSQSQGSEYLDEEPESVTEYYPNFAKYEKGIGKNEPKKGKPQDFL